MTLSAARAYALWAGSYDVENVVTTLEHRAVTALTPPLHGRTLLDAGCGTGRRLPLQQDVHAVGCDLVPQMLAHARRRGARGIAAADLRALPFADASFDVAWCRLAIGHLADIDTAYAELARVARPGARVIVSDFHAAAARAGHRRTFRDEGGVLHAVEHHVHDADAHVAAARAAGLTPAACEEPAVSGDVRSWYEAAGRLEAFEEQRGLPLVLVLAFTA